MPNQGTAFFLKPIVLNTAILILLLTVCFFVYAGFQNIYFTITQDHIPTYVGGKYILAHPAFIFIIDYPHFYPLFHPYLNIIRNITGDRQWLNVIFSLLIHSITAFIVFKISQLFCQNKIIPSLMAALFFLISNVHHDNLMDFSHSYPIPASFFAVFSLYLFVKSLGINSEFYNRRNLYLSFIFYFISVCFGESFIGLILFYFVVMLIKWRKAKKDIFYLFFIFVVIAATISVIRAWLMQFYRIECQPLSISLSWIVYKVRHFNYSFLHLVALFFPKFTLTIATFLNKTKDVVENVSTYHNRYFPYFSLTVLFIPLMFLNWKKILKLYMLWLLIFLLFIPYLFSRAQLADRHLTQTITGSSLFLGLLIYYVLELIAQIKKNIILRHLLNFIFILAITIFFLRFTMLSRRDVKQFINYHSSFSASIEKFVSEFNKVKINNTKKQIYFFTNDIPKNYSFIGSVSGNCYYIFYLAIKYKKLPIDLYSFVYDDLLCGKMNEERCKNYFISLSDGSCFGFFRDKKILNKIINDNLDISPNDIIVLTWDNKLEQERFVPDKK